ncbi:putative glycoside hydrolase [Kribbella sp. NPDC000426]|uniref:putative glycoside hydrolase n=1 Tax=Kribbella sp. NPDC000426 TaxID=3154255 RepID=UPI003329B69D
MSDAPRNTHGITRRSLLAGAAVAALAAGTTTSAQAAPSLTLPNPPADGIARGQVFDNQIPDRSVYAGLVSFVWGASSLAQPAGAVPSAYMPAFRDFDQSHTLAWYQTNHPDWIVYKADGTTVAWEFGNTTYVPIDFQNPDVRTFYWNSFVQPKIDAGYPIIAFDNVLTFNGYGNAGHYDGTQWVPQYSGDRVDDVWAEAVLDWLSYLSGRLHALGIGMAANITWNASVKVADMLEAVGLVDVYVDEQGFTVHRPENYNDAAWDNKFNFTRQIAAQTLHLAINETTEETLATATQEQIDWAVANYLLYREQKSMMTLCGVGEYHVFVDCPQLHTNIGTPSAAPVLDASGAYTRSYQHGLTLVNRSSTATAVVTLPAGTWTDLHGSTVSGQLSMPPNSGSVLSNL